jgi:hypothetical protein
VKKVFGLGALGFGLGALVPLLLPVLWFSDFLPLKKKIKKNRT